VAPFAALDPEPTPAAWRALTALPGDNAYIISPASLTVPPEWNTVNEIYVAQLAADEMDPDDDPEIVPLFEADVPAMMELAARTHPGPFEPHTIALGGYVGIRRNGALVAMAGRRFRSPGWIEVSAVCTDPSERGRGLGGRVTAAVMRGIHADGAQPFLHVVHTNPARRLYESMGFTCARRRHVTVIERA
jgi:ribosomal protein S18 acetylase RimI-like enzyme